MVDGRGLVGEALRLAGRQTTPTVSHTLIRASGSRVNQRAKETGKLRHPEHSGPAVQSPGLEQDLAGAKP